MTLAKHKPGKHAVFDHLESLSLSDVLHIHVFRLSLAVDSHQPLLQAFELQKCKVKPLITKQLKLKPSYDNALRF